MHACRTIRLLILFIILAAPTGARAFNLASVRDSVFKIQVVSQTPKAKQPWTNWAPRASSGTGFFIGNGRILTNAHVVQQGKFITVLRDGSDRPATARVAFVAHDADLAILEVKNPAYLEGARPLRLGGMPKLRRPVATIGYPKGGDQLSVTEGIVSRIGYRIYAHTGAHQHLLVQVDSAINPGNSGGPVVQGSWVVGVAFQAFTEAENTGYIIPTPVIDRFLKDIEDGRYDGHPDDGLTIADDALENRATRAYYGLPAETTKGVVVQSVAEHASAAGHIRPDDVLLAIDDLPIGLDGRVPYHGERVTFKAMFDLKQMGEQAMFTVWRDGHELSVPVTARPATAHYEKGRTFAERPRYYVFAGLVFTALSRNYLQGWGSYWYQKAPLYLRYLHSYADFDPKVATVRDIIVLADRLPHPVNSYADRFTDQMLDSVNGKKVTSLEELKEAIETAAGDFLALRFEPHNPPLILGRAAAVAADPVIKEQYGAEPPLWLGSESDDGAVAGWDQQGGEP